MHLHRPLGGVTTQTVFAVNQATTVPAPTIIGCDNFTGTTGASMSGRAVTVAAACASRTWAVHSGTWTIQSNRAGSTTTTAVATINTATSAATVRATVTASATGRRAGVVGSHNATSTYLAAVLVDAATDRLELRIYNVAVSTALATANITLTTSNTVSFTRSGTALSASLNGTPVVTATLTGTQSTLLGTSGRSRSCSSNNTALRFDDFLVTTP